MAMLSAACGPMTPADYAASKQRMEANMPELKTAYRNGQTPAQIRQSIKKTGLKSFGEETTYRPANGWAPSSWPSYFEQSGGSKVSKVERFQFAGARLLSPVLYFHRVYYNAKGLSCGWYVTQD